MDKKRIRKVENLVGVATIFSLIVGFIVLLVAIVSFVSGDYSAAGLSLIAAALGFGLFSVAVFND